MTRWKIWGSLLGMMTGGVVLLAQSQSTQPARVPDNGSMARSILSVAKQQSRFRPTAANSPNPPLDYRGLKEHVGEAKNPPPVESPNRSLNYRRLRTTVEELQEYHRNPPPLNTPLNYQGLQTTAARKKALENLSPNDPLAYRRLNDAKTLWQERKDVSPYAPKNYRFLPRP